MSDGVGDYIRLVKQEVDARALHDKKIVNEACLLLAAECVRIDSDVQPSFSYPTDRDGAYILFYEPIIFLNDLDSLWLYHDYRYSRGSQNAVSANIRGRERVPDEGRR